MLSVDLKWYSGSAVNARMNEYLVIVDTFRATSMIATLLSLGVRRIIPVAGVEEALSIKSKNPDFVLVGEERGARPEGFTFGNSPSTVFANGRAELEGKTVVHRSSAGTQALVNAWRIKKEQQARYTIYCASLLNVGAVASYIAKRNQGRDERLTVLCSGYVDKIYALEDEVAGGALISALKSIVPLKMNEVAASAYLSFRGSQGEDILEILRNTRSGAKIIEVGEEADIEFCSRLNIFDAVPVMEDAAVVPAH